MANDRDPETNAAAFLGAELRRARLAAGIKSQDKLAQMLGYDRSVIAKAETGERPPSEDVMEALVKTLGLGQVVTRLALLARRDSRPVPGLGGDRTRSSYLAHLAVGLDTRAAADT
jgi:transcriptional regulator with XRE-family HTH domain